MGGDSGGDGGVSRSEEEEGGAQPRRSRLSGPPRSSIGTTFLIMMLPEADESRSMRGALVVSGWLILCIEVASIGGVHFYDSIH